MNNEGKDATLSREQVERYYAEVTSPDELGITDPRMKAVFDMALRYRDVLDQEPVAWLHKETKELNNGWDAILDNTGNWIPLIVAPGGEK